MGYQPNVVNKGDKLIINGRRFEATKDFNAQTDTVLKLRLVKDEKPKTIFVINEGENDERNQEIECMIGILKAMNDNNARAVVVEEWIQKNGPLPNKYGEEVRQILMDGQEE